MIRFQLQIIPKTTEVIVFALSDDFLNELRNGQSFNFLSRFGYFADIPTVDNNWKIRNTKGNQQDEIIHGSLQQ